MRNPPVEGTSAPHCTAGQNKTLEDAEQRGAQKLHIIELSEVGTDASQRVTFTNHKIAKLA